MVQHDMAAIQKALHKQGVGTQQAPSYVTLGECCEILGLNLPKLHRLMKQHQIPVQRKERDLRQKYVDLNAIKAILNE